MPNKSLGYEVYEAFVTGNTARYMMYLYCLPVQACFYIDVVKYLDQKVPGLLIGRGALNLFSVRDEWLPAQITNFLCLGSNWRSCDL